MLVVSVIDAVDEGALVVPIEERLGIKALATMIMNLIVIVLKSMMRWCVQYSVEVHILMRQISWTLILKKKNETPTLRPSN